MSVVKIISATQQQLRFSLGEADALLKSSRSKMTSALLAGLVPWAALWFWPELQVDVLARAAAQFAALFLGCGVVRDELGWTLLVTPVSSTVSAACSGGDFLVVAAAVWAWCLGSRGWSFTPAFYGRLRNHARSIFENGNAPSIRRFDPRDARKSRGAFQPHKRAHSTALLVSRVPDMGGCERHQFRS